MSGQARSPKRAVILRQRSVRIALGLVSRPIPSIPPALTGARVPSVNTTDRLLAPCDPGAAPGPSARKSESGTLFIAGRVRPAGCLRSSRWLAPSARATTAPRVIRALPLQHVSPGGARCRIGLCEAAGRSPRTQRESMMTGRSAAVPARKTRRVASAAVTIARARSARPHSADPLLPHSISNRLRRPLHSRIVECVRLHPDAV